MKSLQAWIHQLPKTDHPPTHEGFKPVTARHRPTALTSVPTSAVSRRLTLRDSELGLTRPALGADYYLTSLTSVMHREDVGIT